jgi:sulfate permease, SulP family
LARRALSVSTTITIAILAGAEIGRAVPGGDQGALIAASATLAVVTGVFLVAASVLRLGFVANFISEPVLTGFKSGIGLVIVVDQIPKLLGVHIEKVGFFAIYSRLQASCLTPPLPRLRPPVVCSC